MLGNKLVGRYQISSHLGGGGFGETFVAYDTQLPGSPKCVVKKLKPQATDPVSLETARRLFDTEAQVLYQLGTHDHIPQLLAYFEENEEFYLVQEFIEGQDLSEEIIPGKPLSQEQVIVLLQEILEILQFVHEQKVIHRDVNPHNIIRQKQDGKLFLIDFGAVKQITTHVVNPDGKTKLTIAIGTPGYIPGEQAQGDPKFSSDIYAVGIIGIQALTGLSPENLEKDSETNEIIWRNHSTVDENFAKVLDKMTRYDFRQRYPSATVALQALKDLHSSYPQTIALSPPSPKPKNPPVKTTKSKKSLLIKIITGSILTSLAVVAALYINHMINSANANELYQQGNTFYELQRYKDALAAFEKAVQLQPNYTQAWNGQAQTLSELKEYKQALTAYDRAIQIQPNYLDAWRGRGFALSNLQRYEEAIASFDKTLQLNNKYPEVWNAKGEALSHLKQYNNAIKAYDKAIELKPDYYEACYNKGWALQNLKQYDQSLTAYDKAVELKPDYEQAWYNRGNVLVNLQRYQDAFTSYDKAVQYQPNHYQAWLSRGNVLLNLQRYPDAIESFNQVIKYNPNSYRAWYNKAWSLHQLQHYQEAVESYNKAIGILRNNYQAWYGLGNSLYNLHKYAEAIASYNKAIRYKPDHYESWYSKGNALMNLKRYQEAIVSYDRAIKIKPDYQPAINSKNQAQQGLTKSQQLPFPPNNQQPPFNNL